MDPVGTKAIFEKENLANLCGLGGFNVTLKKKNQIRTLPKGKTWSSGIPSSFYLILFARISHNNDRWTSKLFRINLSKVLTELG